MPLRDIDRRLLERCLNHEPDAWNDFVDRYMGLIYHVIHHTAFARSLTFSPQDVEDLCGQVMLQLVDRDYAVLRNFRQRSSLASYLTVVARRAAIHEIVRRKMESAMGRVEVGQATLVALGATPEPEARIANQEEVNRMLDGLPPTEAEVVRLYHLQGLSYRLISEQLGIPENSVGPTLHRARERLRRAAAAERG